MSIFKKINLILLIFLLFGFCSKKQKEKDHLKKYDTKEITGTWKILPSGGEKIIIELGGKAKILEKDGNQIPVFLYADPDGMRVLYSETSIVPIGYFLFHERKQNLWAGVYKKQLVRLEKEIYLKSTILE